MHHQQYPIKICRFQKLQTGFQCFCSPWTQFYLIRQKQFVRWDCNNNHFSRTHCFNRISGHNHLFCHSQLILFNGVLLRTQLRYRQILIKRHFIQLLQRVRCIIACCRHGVFLTFQTFDNRLGNNSHRISLHLLFDLFRFKQTSDSVESLLKNILRNTFHRNQPQGQAKNKN